MTRKFAIAAALALAGVVGMVPMAGGRSVSYTGDGGGEEGPFPPQSCEVLAGYVDAPFDECWGILRGNNVLDGNLAWCTYALTEHNPFFVVTEIDRAAATIVFRRTLSGPVQIQFNGETDEDFLHQYAFNVTFGFDDDFARGDEIRFDFNPDPADPSQTASATVSTISIHIGPYAIPYSQENTAGGDSYAGIASPVQAHKCQDPGSARR